MNARYLRIRPTAAARERGYVALQLVSPCRADMRYAPAAGALPLIARLSDPNLALSVSPADGALEEVSWPARALARLRRAIGAVEGARLDYGGVEIFPEGSRAATRRFRKHVEASRRHDSTWDGEWLARRPEIIVGWPKAEPRGRPAVPPRFAVAAHLYYTELWDELETLLNRQTLPFRLFLTLNRPDEALQARALEAFPDANVRVVDNLGRDVRPFLQWLEEDAFAGFACVCKLHGKRSYGGGRLPAFGDALRRTSFHDLIADPARVGEIVSRFEATPDLGLVGSERFLVRSTSASPKDVIGANRMLVEALARRLHAPLTEPDFDFFEGTMFWARPNALARLAALGLSRDAFAKEAGRVDGAMEHALERLFNHAARAAGYRIETTRSD